MTERLSALLHQEVDQLTVPVAPVPEALAQGRRLRRRRRLTRGSAIGAVVAVVATAGFGAAMLAGPEEGTRLDDGPAADDPTAAQRPVDLGHIFGAGRTLYLDDGASQIDMDRDYVQSLYYTSAGVLLRTNADGASDGGAPFGLTLVKPGSVSDLDLTLGDVVPATDPRQPYLAYADVRGGTTQVVVFDVAADAEAARVDLPGDVDPGGGWAAPPVALDGDTVYVGGEGGALGVDWRTGDVAPTDLVTAYPVVQSGYSVDTDGNDTRILDLATGEAVVTVPGYASVKISPTGRYAAVAGETATNGFDVHDLETGTTTKVRGELWEFGWTGGDELYSVSTDGIATCSAVDGECVGVPLDKRVDLSEMPRLPGQTFES